MATNPLPPDLLTPSSPVPANLCLRLVEAQDLRPIHSACYPQEPFHRFQALFRRLFLWQENGRCYWVVATAATSDQSTTQIVGSGQLVIYPHGAELANLSVVPAYRNQGIGTAIITVLTAIARYIGLTGVEIGVKLDNQRALALYRRLGFVIDRHRRLLDGKPAIILHKAL